jgi:hypothetical protein
VPRSELGGMMCEVLDRGFSAAIVWGARENAVGRPVYSLRVLRRLLHKQCGSVCYGTY